MKMDIPQHLSQWMPRSLLWLDCDTRGRLASQEEPLERTKGEEDALLSREAIRFSIVPNCCQRAPQSRDTSTQKQQAPRDRSDLYVCFTPRSRDPDQEDRDFLPLRGKPESRSFEAESSLGRLSRS